MGIYIYCDDVGLCCSMKLKALVMSSSSVRWSGSVVCLGRMYRFVVVCLRGPLGSWEVRRARAKAIAREGTVKRKAAAVAGSSHRSL